jgi:hypothetical protein
MIADALRQQEAGSGPTQANPPRQQQHKDGLFSTPDFMIWVLQDPFMQQGMLPALSR